MAFTPGLGPQPARAVEESDHGALSFIGFDLVQLTFAESLKDLESGDAIRLVS